MTTEEQLRQEFEEWLDTLPQTIRQNYLAVIDNIGISYTFEAYKAAALKRNERIEELENKIQIKNEAIQALIKAAEKLDD